MTLDIDTVVEQARNAPVTPPTEWLMKGMTCSVQTIQLGDQPQKALVFWHAAAPDGIRLVFPMSLAGAKMIGDQLADRPTIALPGAAV